jgi:DNA-directed RNA polymerase subunit K/omega
MSDLDNFDADIEDAGDAGDYDDVDETALNYQTHDDEGNPLDEEEEKDDDEEEGEEVDDAAVVDVHPATTNKTKIIDGPKEGISTPYMSKFEYARMAGARAKAIENGLPPAYGDTQHHDALKIAEEEIEMGLCPIYTYRDLGNGTIERWYRRLEGGVIIGLKLLKT